jgi:hypothetical protein
MEGKENATFGKDLTDEETLHAMVEWELNKRRGRSATYTQPLIVENTATPALATSFEEQEDITSFLTEFYGYRIFDSMTDMKFLLQQHTDTVKVHYGLLVPNVCSFDEFWSRYYYRCSYAQVRKEVVRKVNSEHESIGVLEEVGLLERMKLQEAESPTVPCNINPTTSQRRAQLFHQEYDRDIIEIIPEEADDDDPSSRHRSTEDETFETVGLADSEPI